MGRRESWDKIGAGIEMGGCKQSVDGGALMGMEDTVRWTNTNGGSAKMKSTSVIAKHAPGGVAVLPQSLPARVL